jgi:hypothetical protein
MKPETRTKNLLILLGWQGGTVHEACKEIGVDPHDFLYEPADFDDNGPCDDFRRGYEQADDIAIYVSSNRGNLQYWFGAIAFIENEQQGTRGTT